MPIRYISIPSITITFRDPATDAAIKTIDGTKDETVTFDQFLGRLMHNPLWGESYQAIKAQHEIFAAMLKAKERDLGRVIMLSEEDWQRLKQAAEFPKPVGFGYHPGLVSQLLPFLQPIFDAPTTDPRSASAPRSSAPEAETKSA